MLTEQLKHATRHSHAELEKLVIERIRQTNTPARYRHLLGAFYGFYKPMEEQIDRFIDHARLPDYLQRRKSDALLSDMQRIDGPGNLFVCDDLPEITGISRSFGALYVLEGSTLGGSVICKLLAREMGEKAPDVFLFFNGYGDATQAMWANFKNSLNSYSTDSAEHRQVIDAANETFGKFKQWIIQYERT